MLNESTKSLISQVEGLELALPPTEKQTNLFVQGTLHGQVQRTPAGSPKWDSMLHFLIRDITSDKISIAVFKEFSFAPNGKNSRGIFIHHHLFLSIISLHDTI